MRSRPDPRLRAACDRLLNEGVPPRLVERLSAEWSDHLVSATEGLRETGIGSVESGRVLVDTCRRRRVGTYLGLALPEPLEENFATDLEGAMAEG